MNLPSTAKSSTRERVVSYLTLLASDAAVQTLSHLIDPQRLAFELCRVWFDDIYVAGRRYLGGIKGDFTQEAAELFRSAFDSEELKAIERFSQFLELRVDMLPRKALEEGRIPDNDLWRNVVRDAGYLLADLDPDAIVRRRRLSAWLANVDIVDPTDVRHLVESAVTPAED